MPNVDLREWRKILTPCPVLPEPVVSYVFHVNNLSEVRARIIEVLDKYGMPHVAFPDENNIVTCRMRFILDRNDNTVVFQLDLDRIQIDFSRKPKQILTQTGKRVLKTIDFVVALLKEVGLVNSETEVRVRESMIMEWSEMIEIPKTLLPFFIGKLVRSD
jgi:hypothetical protein